MSMRSREQLEKELSHAVGSGSTEYAAAMHRKHVLWLLLDLREQNQQIITLLESRPCGEKHVGSTGTHVCDRPFGHRGMHSGTNATESLGWNG